MHLTWLGHDSFKIEYSDKVIYLNPYAGGPEIYVKQANLILISKNAYDHWSREVINKILGDNTHIFGPVEVSSELFGCRTFTPGESLTFEDGTRIQAVLAKIVRRDSSEQSLGWLITVEKKTLYFTGDSDVTEELREIKADVVIIPVGGTFKAKDAAEAVNIINPQMAIPTHYGHTAGTQDDAELFRELCRTQVVLLEKGNPLRV